MKQYLKKVMVFVVCLIFMAGCGTKEYTAADFVGVWDSVYEFGDETVEFCEDGTFNKVANSFLGELYVTGKYIVHPDRVIVSFDQTGEVDTYDLKFNNDNEMVWTNGDIQFIYTRR